MNNTQKSNLLYHTPIPKYQYVIDHHNTFIKGVFDNTKQDGKGSVTRVNQSIVSPRASPGTCSGLLEGVIKAPRPGADATTKNSCRVRGHKSN